MQNETRKKYSLYGAYLLSKNNTDALGSSFHVPEAEANRLVNLQRESVDLLSRINYVPARDEEGHARALEVGSSAARTNTKVGPRVPCELGVSSVPYLCVNTEYDLSIPFEKLDQLTPFDDFNEKLEIEIEAAKALDKISIAFNGLEAAPETDRLEFPLLQDVNIGWLQKTRAAAPAQVKSGVTIGAGADYVSLDALVYGLIQMLAPEHRKRQDLVVIIDRDLLHAKLLESVSAAGADAGVLAEMALQRILTTGKLGGLSIYDAPAFPSNTVLVTSLRNLSIYYQVNSVRRFIRENPTNNSYEDFSSQSEAFVVENYKLIAFAENVSFIEQ